MQHQRNSRLHIEHAGSVQAAVFTRHGMARQRSEWINRIKVAEQQDWFYLFSPRKIDLNTIGVIFGAMHARPSTASFEPRGQQRAHPVRSEFVVAGDSIATNSRIVWTISSCRASK